MITNEGQRASFLRAVRNGNNIVIQHSVFLGADVNDAGPDGRDAPLLAAIQNNRYSTIDLLLRLGAKVDFNYGESLRAAIKSESPNSVGILLRAGADYKYLWMSPMSKGRTPIEKIDSLSNMEAIRELLINKVLRDSFSLNTYIIPYLKDLRRWGLYSVSVTSMPFNLSLDSWSDDYQMGLFFRYGEDMVVSIYQDKGQTRIGIRKAQAPICAGEGRVIYSRRGQVYENGIDLKGPENALCHELSSNYEKNWGCFKRTEGTIGDYFIVYSVLPLRIFQVTNSTECHELPAISEIGASNYPHIPRVQKDYPNLEAIERLFIDSRDKRDTGIFRGGTRGIEFGGEYLFVGHVTLHQTGRCFPNWYAQKNSASPRNPRMYFMFFYTIRFANDTFSISRMSSCFQPPSNHGLHKIVFPAGIAKRSANSLEHIVISYGQDDRNCRVAFYAVDEVNAMLAPVNSWHPNNYVFHPNYANSMRDSTPRARSPFSTMFPVENMSLIATSPVTDKLFNPSITNGQGDKFVTAWRKFDGSGDTTNWRGYNWVILESCSLQVKDQKLVYSTQSRPVELKLGTTTIGGEDPRLIFENNCPLLLINDLVATLEGPHARRMYIHNLNTDENARTVHPFCHNISGTFEKNWGPFYIQGELHFVYSVDPLLVAKVQGNSCPSSNQSETILCERPIETQTPVNLKDVFDKNGIHVRGGTPGIALSSSEFLFVGHAVTDVGGNMPCFADYVIQRHFDRGDDGYAKGYQKLYTAFFYTVKAEGPNFRLNRISCCSHFPGGKEDFSKIVFPAGLVKANLGGMFEEAFIVSFGVKDTHGVFCALNRKFLDYVLRPVEHWNSQNYIVDVNYFQNIADLSPGRVGSINLGSI